MKKIFSKTLGLVLTLALISSQVFTVIPFSIAASTGVFIDTVEYAAERVYKVSGNTNASVNNGVLYLKGNNSTDNIIPRDESGNPYTIEITEGNTYKFLLQFDYKYEQGHPSAGSIYLYGAFINPAAMTSNVTTSGLMTFIRGQSVTAPGVYSSIPGATDGQWHTASIPMIYTATADTELIIGLKSTVSSWHNYYIDNIQITSVSTDKETGTVYFNTNGGNTLTPATGCIGDNYKMPEPSKGEDFSFAGWYTDEEFSMPYDGKFPANGTTLYAKWDDGDTGGGNIGTVFTDTVEYDAERVYKVSGNTNASVIDGTLYLKGSSSTDNIIPRDENGNPYTVEMTEGNTYKFLLQFDYKYEQGHPSAGSIYLYGAFINPAAMTSNVTTSGLMTFIRGQSVTAPGVYSSIPGATDGQWHTASIPMIYTATADTELIIGLKSTVSSWHNYYLDNIQIIPVPADKEFSTVYFQTNGGNTIAPATAVAGSDFVPSVPYKKNSLFEGWYSDADLATKFDGNIFAGVNTLYAKWIIPEDCDVYKTMTEDFEQYDDSISPIGNNFADTDSIHQKLEIIEENGNKYFRYSVDKNKIDSSSRFIPNFAIFDKNDTNFEGLKQFVSKNEIYNILITYDYKVNTAGTNDEWGVCLMPILIDENYNTLGSPAEPTIIRFGKNNYRRVEGWYNVVADDEWHTASLVVEIKSNYAGYVNFGFNFDASKRIADICLDNIKVEFLEPDNSYSNITIDSNGLPVAFDTVAGKVGTPISLDLPSDLYKRSAKFTGWTYENGTLYTVDDTFGESDAVITPSFEGGYGIYDYNFDNTVDIRDLVKLKKSLASSSGYALTVPEPAELLTEMKRVLVSVDTIVNFGDTSYTLMYSDEFNSLDSTVWFADEMGEGAYSYDSNGKVVYRNDIDVSLLSVSDGNAEIRYARTETGEIVDVYSYNHNGNTVYAYNPTDEEITTNGMQLVQSGARVYNASNGNLSSRNRMSFKYGYIEARVKLPGNSIGANFWLANNSTNGNLFNEIDIFETMNSKKLMANIHTWNLNNNQYHADWDAKYGIDNRNLLGGNNSYEDRYYVLGLEWKKDDIIFYSDGVEKLRISRNDTNAVDFAGFDTEWPLDVRFGAVLYNGNTNIENAVYKIDYVRLYQNVNYDDNQFNIN